MPRDPNVSAPPGFPSGGGGLYSTGGDYLRFAQMLRTAASWTACAFSRRARSQLMTSNHVPDAMKAAGKFGIGNYPQQPGFGFGFDVAIYEDPPTARQHVGKGTFLWDGIAGTWFWIDPTNDIVFVGIIQRWAALPTRPRRKTFPRKVTYEALVDASK